MKGCSFEAWTVWYIIRSCNWAQLTVFSLRQLCAGPGSRMKIKTATSPEEERHVVDDAPPTKLQKQTPYVKTVRQATRGQLRPPITQDIILLLLSIKISLHLQHRKQSHSTPHTYSSSLQTPSNLPSPRHIRSTELYVPLHRQWIQSSLWLRWPLLIIYDISSRAWHQTSWFVFTAGEWDACFFLYINNFSKDLACTYHVGIVW